MTALLAGRSWWLIRAVSQAYNLRFNANWSKEQGLAQVRAELLEGGRLKRAFRALSETERAPLVALQAAGGAMPFPRFVEAFGSMRRFRPWQPELEPRHPWKRPISVTEKLWHFGFIDIVDGKRGQSDQVVIADEVLALLPPLPEPELAEENETLITEEAGAGSVCHDLAALLGTLSNEEVRPIHGRWLPRWALEAWGKRSTANPPLTIGIRSELQTGRGRFVHYLAEIAGLVALGADGILRPSAAAWGWLALSHGEQWERLRSAVESDVCGRERLWDSYRLPNIEPRVWKALIAQLRKLEPHQTYTVKSLVLALVPHLPGRDLRSIREALAGPLAWLGVVAEDEGVRNFRILSPLDDQTPSFPARLTAFKDAIVISLPADSTPLRPLVELWSFAALKGRTLRLDASALRRAVENGYTAQQVAALLAELTGAPISPDVYVQIESWTRRAAGLTLRWLPVLTVTDAETMRAIRSDWRLRPLLGEMLSPHHVVVQGARADELCRKLERRGLAVTDFRRDNLTPKSPRASGKDEADYLYLAVRIYQRLADLVSLPARIPGGIVRSLAEALPPERAESLDGAAKTVLEKLRQTLEGQIVAAGGVSQEQPESIRASVEAAQRSRVPLTIEYFSPARGESTIRTIEPILLYARNGAEYVEAYCQREEDARTFRIDRIVRIVRPLGN